MMPEPEAVILNGYPDGKPRVGVAIGENCMTLKQADAYAIKLLDACAQARAVQQRESVNMTCARCKYEYVTKQEHTARCFKCKLVQKVPVDA